MSDGSEPVSPEAGKPTRKVWRPRVPYANIASVVLCSGMAAAIIRFDLWPPDPLRFLRLAATSATYRPYGHGLGAGLAAYMGWKFLTMKRPDTTDRTKSAMVEAVEFLVGLAASAAVGFCVGWFAVTFWLPFTQHLLAGKQDVEYRFTLTGDRVGRPCRGVIGINTAFYDDELCGVRMTGSPETWEGRTLVVTGRQSAYGMMRTGYRRD
ncbi:hypothetical protein NS365_07615 [Aureimonas ureilytica]|uniref:Uncharacterized protein n=1 Tax=Aureimonas ureilytica TaxID=401562 RepID=A0A175RTH3_9HYPH|nr:hypothetical protein [Aureimonas ureilytica]KTR06284.1 hypothetical protein NS365_07615 [Aureimonas ureilytica]